MGCGGLLSEGNRSPDFQDAGTGMMTVNVFGGVTRPLRLPQVQTGMQGVAALYHSTFQFDTSYTAWDGDGTSLTGSIARPNLDADNLVSGAEAVQPRPGTMPGQYIYQVNGHFYQYGSPIDSGANPQSTADYYTELDTSRFSNQLSGAQLWYYSGSPSYIEIKHVDGSIARFDWFDPYKSTYSPVGTLWRLTSVRDPYDNVANYVYSSGSSHRLLEIQFPSGLTQEFNYAPSWGSWPSGYDRLQISYSQTIGSTTTALSGMTWGMVFYGTTGTSGGLHFGKRLYRTYSASRQILLEPSSAGATYSISSSSPVTGQVVHELSYSTSSRVLTETQLVHTGTSFAQTLSSPSGLPSRQILSVTYGSGSDYRVASMTDSLTGAGVTFAYTGSGLRTTDLNGASLYAILATDSLGGERRYEYDVNTGRIYSIIHTPSDDAAGRPRAHDSGNSGIGGVASTDVEPTKITTYNIFDSTCTCQKPIEVREISHRGSSDYTRTATFAYDSVSKLLTARSETNPATVGTLPLPDDVSWAYTYIRAKTSSQNWGAWLPETEVTPDGTYTYTYSNWLDRANYTEHGQIAGTVVRSISGVRIQTSLTSGSTSTTTTVSETLHRNLSNSPGSYSQMGSINGQLRAIVDGDGIVATMEYGAVGWLDATYEHGGSVKTVFTHGASGNVESITSNASSTAGLDATIDYSDQSAYGLVYTASTSDGGLDRTSKFYYDRFGHLAVVRKNNLNSSGDGPSKHGSSSSARDYVETQYQFQHHRLMEDFHDRKPRDEAAGTGQFLKTEYVYLSNGRIDYVILPNGSRTDYDLDGFGTLYRSVTQDPAAAQTVSSSKRFINPFLEVTGSYQYTGSDHLWTTITRNGAGAITQIAEPSTTAPSGYDGATGGAIHQFEIDERGRVVEARAYTGAPSSTTLATRRETHYDQLNRLIWQHDLALGFGSSGDHYVAWQYASAKASQLSTVKRTGVADQTHSYNNSTSPVTGFLTTINDGLGSGGNTITYAYHSHTRFLSGITRVDLDPANSTPRTTATTYDVDPFGRVVVVTEGSGTTLDRAYAYDSLAAR